MAPLPFNTLTVGDSTGVPTNLNIHLDAHHAPGYSYLSTDDLSRPTILPLRGFTNTVQPLNPLLPVNPHQTSDFATLQRRDAQALGSLQLSAQLGPWDYALGALLILVVVSLVAWMGMCGEKTSSSAFPQPSRRRYRKLRFDFENNAARPPTYSYDTITVAAGDGTSADPRRRESPLEVCELAMDMASRLSRTRGDSADHVLLDAARRCKCQVCRADVERLQYR